VTEGVAGKTRNRSLRLLERIDMSDEELEPIDAYWKLPLGDWHRARGARMVEFAGYAYADPI
jgi:hypothetical protein